MSFRLAFVVNGGPLSAMADRAAGFASRLRKKFDIRCIYREGGKAAAVAAMLRQLGRFRPAICYVLDMAASGVIAAGLYKAATGTPLIVDTGDAIVELGRVLGRGTLGLSATRALEAYSLRVADRIVVRGSYHKELLARRGVRAEFIPDGVDLRTFSRPLDFLKSHPSSRPLVLGLVGSSVWVPSRGICYGWELVEVVRLLKGQSPRAVRGVLVGDGSGVEVLRKRCEQYNIQNDVEFLGRVEMARLPDLLREFDICLSTQTDDAIGRVRTTGKLPLYLAAGRFVLASRVGEAARILPPNMLVDYYGSVDLDYPKRLADRILTLLKNDVDFSFRPESVALARSHFDYDMLSRRVEATIRSVVSPMSCGRLLAEA